MILVVFISGVLSPGLSSGITIKEEEELSRQFLGAILANFPIIDDPIVVRYINRIGKEILASFPQQPFKYHFYVIKDDAFNAFATPAGHIFIHSGLMAAMDDEEELAGIIGHEISHVYCRHISQKIERSKKLNIATMAGLAAGILAGVAGAGEAAGALTMGTMAAGQTAALAYSREDEVQADQIGLQYTEKAGYDGKGLLVALNRIRSKQWYGADMIPKYLMTHPAVEDRLAYIDTYLDKNKQKNITPAEHDPREFHIARMRVLALYTDENIALRELKTAVADNPDDIFSRYGYGMVLARAGNLSEAAAILKRALEINAFNPEILTALGQVYFLKGDYPQAQSTFKSALSISPHNPETLFYFGRTQLELDNPAQAEAAFKQLTKNPPVNKQVYYFLGKAYGRQGKMVDAHYTLGIYYMKKRELRNARVQFAQALKKTNDPDERKELEERLAKIDTILKKQKKG